MNERIEELYKQSFIEVRDENSFPCMIFSKQKFAELLLTECLNIAWEEDTHESHRIGYQISKHFGLI